LIEIKRREQCVLSQANKQELHQFMAS